MIAYAFLSVAKKLTYYRRAICDEAHIRAEPPSLEDSGLHGEFKYLVALLEHLMLQRSVVSHGQFPVLEDELLHDVAVVDVDGEDLGQADEDVVLDAVLGVDKRRQLLGEVDCLVHGHLGGLLLVLLEEESERFDHL